MKKDVDILVSGVVVCLFSHIPSSALPVKRINQVFELPVCSEAPNFLCFKFIHSSFLFPPVNNPPQGWGSINGDTQSLLVYECVCLCPELRCAMLSYDD
ncbi:uncharacterized protein F4822DRAFT_45399 [Hypoxylon trugodes]|uniref:uncharacterized protein n=1 Tax=Hypoxylon trugodes TaxID=326681 RepID=UPI0021A08C63|nr:uncharacterized protein F4822DRAFT_45399 [Hypoxylon trugodes]KAI1394338.1 hypothetical protein F4822DRAFT_45399 [Hypoxylon trugodes]